MNTIPCMLILISTLLSLEVYGFGQAATPTLPTPKTQFSPPGSSAQSPSGDDDQAETTPLIPVIKINFQEQAPIPKAIASPVYVTPIFCAPDGVPFVDFPQPPDYMGHSVYSLDPVQAVGFSASSIQGLYDVTFKGYFAGDSVVGLLVRATTDDKKATYTVTILPGTPPRPVYEGKHYDYVVEFDRTGTFKKTIPLPTIYDFVRIAALPDTTFFAVAYNRVNAVAQLLVLDSGGQIIRTLQIPSQLENSPELKQGESGGELGRVKAESSLSWWLFAPARQRILLYQAHSKSPVLEVGAGGVVREVPLEAPTGYVLDGVISANDRWIMRYRREKLSDSGEIDSHPETKNYVLYEVNPSDGSLRRRIDVGAGPLFSIACEHDGILNAFSLDGQKIVRKTANIFQ